MRQTCVQGTGCATASVEQSIADKPSIAVLPFDNLSGDPEQDFIGDGLTEDIIAGLSRIRSFFVIARNSTFQYKGTSPDIRRVAGELGVRYVLEGSVRKAGDRVRVTAQLIDAAANTHLWSERFDREFTDIFAVQDEITGTIVAQLEPELSRVEYERSKSEQPENLDAWELFHRGMQLFIQMRDTHTDEARRLFEQAVERDPRFAPAYAGVAWTYVHSNYQDGTVPDLDAAIRAARQAVELDDKNSFAHCALGSVYALSKRSDDAISEMEEGLRINPSNALGQTMMGYALFHSGNAGDAIPHIELGIR